MLSIKHKYFKSLTGVDGRNCCRCWRHSRPDCGGLGRLLVSHCRMVSHLSPPRHPGNQSAANWRSRPVDHPLLIFATELDGMTVYTPHSTCMWGHFCNANIWFWFHIIYFALQILYSFIIVMDTRCVLLDELGQKCRCNWMTHFHSSDIISHLESKLWIHYKHTSMALLGTG